MALSVEQKLRNKEAAARRSKAFFERRKKYWQAIAEEQEKFEMSSEFLEKIKVNEDFDRILKNKSEILFNLREKISKINIEIESVEESFSVEINKINVLRTDSGKVCRQMKSEYSEKIDSKFPDMVRVHTPAGWKPLEDF